MAKIVGFLECGNNENTLTVPTTKVRRENMSKYLAGTDLETYQLETQTQQP